MHVTKRLIEEGLGVSFLPESAAYRELTEGRVMEVPVPPTLKLPRAGTYLVLPAGDELPPAAGELAALLRRTFGREA